MPALFISHGAPTLALEPEGTCARALRRWAEACPSPRALLVMSAHWEAPGPIRVTSAGRPPLIYDFAGFPDPLYALTYPAPGDPGLAAEVIRRLHDADLPAQEDPDRGWDHGVWIPLRLAFPEPRIPVVEISLPRRSAPEELMRIGRALSALRSQGVLLIGSGGIVHNLRLIRLERKEAPADSWALEFDEWVRTRLERHDFDALIRYREVAPHAALAVPTTEHFDPLFFVLGASGAEDDVVEIHDGIQYGNLSMRCFALQGRGATCDDSSSSPS
ncbi:MAG TPA: class III extradiol ring-cleavage dioxygenase [Candidatus Polarisedimenticolia bacterium]